MKSPGKLVVALFFIFAIYPTANAQEIDAAKDSTRLVLQVRPYQSVRPEYCSIPGTRTFAFRKTENWDAVGESSRAATIRLAYAIEKDVIKIDLTVSHGEFQDKFSPVRTYLAYEHRPLILSDMSQFGVEPFQIMVVRMSKESDNSVPQVTSNAPSIEVVGVEVVDPVIQLYTVSFRNNSKKNLYEMQVHSYRKTAEAGIMWPTGERGQWLAGPGEVFTAKITSFGYGSLTRDSYIPDLMTRAVVKEALFDDGTFEGDTKIAAGRVAVTRGRAMQLERIIKFFQATSAQSDADVSPALKKLISQVESLPIKLDEETKDRLVSEHPVLFKEDLSELIIGFEAGLTGFKRTVVADIVKFKNKSAQSGSAVSFNQWLTEATGEYERWAATMR